MLTPLTARFNTGQPMICHGALGTMLQSDDEEFNRAPELVNLNGPRRVLKVQRAYLVAGARRYAALDVKLIGGCCGSTPAHIAAMAAALASLKTGG